MVVTTRRRGFDHEPTVDSALDSDDDSAQLTKKERDERERQRRRNQKRKEKKKARKARKEEAELEADEGVGDSEDVVAEEDDVEVEYVAKEENLDLSDPNYFYFQKIFQAFKIGEEKKAEESSETEKASEVKKEESQEDAPKMSKGMIIDRIVAQEEEERREKEKEKQMEGSSKISKRKMRLNQRPSIAALKASCTRPDVVEWHDVTSKEPFLLVYIKSLRNTVPVPRHWYIPSCTRPDVVEWHDVASKEPFLLVYIKFLRNTVPVPLHWYIPS